MNTPKILILVVVQAANKQVQTVFVCSGYANAKTSTRQAHKNLKKFTRAQILYLSCYVQLINLLTVW